MNEEAAPAYARQTGGMKDLPALLCAVLSIRSPEMLTRALRPQD